MGRQIIAYDTAIFIYVFEDHPVFFDKAAKALKKIVGNEFTGVFSVIGIIELLTGPKKENRPDLVSQYREKILNFPNLIVKNLNTNIVELASDLRAKYNLPTPDAIHIATAIDAGATTFYTNDKKLKMVKEVKVKTL